MSDLHAGPCKTCVYFDAKAKECHRYPPSPHAVPHVNPLTSEPQVSVMGLFPAARPDWYCGEHRPAEDA